MNERELVLAGVNVPEMMDRFMHNEKLVHMLVGKFLEDRTYEQLRAAVAAGDMKAAEMACHSLKGVCGNMALNSLFAHLQEQLRLFRNGDADQAVSMMDVISGEYETAVSHMRSWLAEK